MHLEVLIYEAGGEAAVAVSGERRPHIRREADTWDVMFYGRNNVMKF